MTESQSPWELDYLQRQARINGYAWCCLQPRIREVDKIMVSHPDEYRRYLQQHPCMGCQVEAFCDRPCGAYLKWYNARLEAAKVRDESRRNETRDNT